MEPPGLFYHVDPIHFYLSRPLVLTSPEVDPYRRNLASSLLHPMPHFAMVAIEHTPQHTYLVVH
jgi:hypothetical protein